MVDVVVLAGDRHGSRAILGESKVFLPLAGASLLEHVLRAVDQARTAGRIFVIGDRARIASMLATTPAFSRPIVVLEQDATFYENAWKGYGAAAGDGDDAVLYVPGDAPLVTARELDDFVAACDPEQHDYSLGMTSDATLRAYRSEPGRPALPIECFAGRGLLLRQTNLHLVRLRRVGNRGYIQTVYALRHQREWSSIARVFLELFRHGGSLRLLWTIICAHVSRYATRTGRRDAALFRPFFLPLASIEETVSRFLRTRFKIVISPHGGAAIDVDDEGSYAIIQENFERWRDLTSGEGEPTAPRCSDPAR